MPLTAASGQVVARDVQVAVTDRGEIVVVWAALLDHNGGSAVRYAVAAPGRSFSGTRTLAAVGSFAAATPRIAALRGGTVAVIFRDTSRAGSTGVLRYARRARTARSAPPARWATTASARRSRQRRAAAALLAWGRGPLTRRALEVGSAARGETPPGAARSVAGRIRRFTLSAAPDGTAWAAWTRGVAGGATGFARRTRAGNTAAVGPVRSLGTLAYGVPHVALDASGRVLVAWNARGPGAQPNAGLATAQGTGAALGAPAVFDAGGFSQTSPVPALVRGTPLVLFTRQIPTTTGAPAEAAAANPGTGEATVLGPAGGIGAPAIAQPGAGIVVAWAARGGGAAASTLP